MIVMTYLGRVPAPFTGLITEMRFSTRTSINKKLYQVHLKVFDSVQSYRIFGYSTAPITKFELGCFVDVDLALRRTQFVDTEVLPLWLTVLSIENIDNPFDYIPAQTEPQKEVKRRLSRDFDKMSNASKAIVRHFIQLRPDLFLQFIFKCDCEIFLTDLSEHAFSDLIRSRLAEDESAILQRPTPLTVARFVFEMCKANKSNPIRLHYRFYADLVRINAKRSVRKKPPVGLERDFAREVLLLLEQNRILAVPNDFLRIYKPSIDLIQDLWLANVSSEDQPANLLLDR